MEVSLYYLEIINITNSTTIYKYLLIKVQL